MATLFSESHVVRSEAQDSRRARSDIARLEKLYELVAQLAACNDLDSALYEVLDASIEVSGADAGFIRLFYFEEADPLASWFPFVAHRGLSEEYVSYFENLGRPVTREGRQASYEGRRVIVEDMMSHPIYEAHREVVVAEGYRTQLSTSLMSPVGPKCVGVVCTYFREVQTPPYAGVETLDLYAELAATTIDHHQHIAELARRERSWGVASEEQADVLRWARERLTELEDSAPQIQPRELAELAHSIASRLGQVESASPVEADRVPDDQYADSPYGLSPSELEVLINVWRGLSDKEMATVMGVSRFTVAKYLGSAMRKLNVEDRSQASLILARDILSREGGLNPPFRDLLRTFRRRSGLTQLELAEKARLSPRTISDLERGVRTKVYIPTVSMIAAALALEEGDATMLAASVDRSRKSRVNRYDESLTSPD